MGLPPESIDSTRRIKPTTRRSVGQCTTHFITKLCSPEAANQAIRDRLIIEGKQVWARRMKKEPRICLKCQSMRSNHLAAECDQTAIAEPVARNTELPIAPRVTRINIGAQTATHMAMHHGTTCAPNS